MKWQCLEGLEDGGLCTHGTWGCVEVVHHFLANFSPVAVAILGHLDDHLAEEFDCGLALDRKKYSDEKMF